MRLSDDQKESLKKITELTKDIKIAMLSTLDQARGSIHSRPMAMINQKEEGKIWFYTFSNSEKAYEIKNKDEVNLSFADIDKNIYVSVSGNAEIVDDSDKKKELWNDILKMWFKDGPQTENLSLLCVHITEADYWDAHEGRMVRILNNIKSLLGKDANHDIGHEKINLRKV